MYIYSNMLYVGCSATSTKNESAKISTTFDTYRQQQFAFPQNSLLSVKKKKKKTERMEMCASLRNLQGSVENSTACTYLIRSCMI